jgi:SAM-dependent methyltransferase
VIELAEQLHRQAGERYASDYGDVARGYAAVLEPTLEPVAARIAELADVGLGVRVLDLATGTGLVARTAAASGAEVVGIDISPGMIDVARTYEVRAIEFLVADAAALPFDDGSFDAVTCAFGLSHMPDVAAVLAEVRRVLAPDGRFVDAATGLAVLARHVDEIHAFAGILDESTWADAERARTVVAAAGFSGVAVVTERFAGWFADAQAALARTLTWPDYGQTVAALDLPQRSTFEREALRALANVAELTWEFAVNYLVADRGR